MLVVYVDDVGIAAKRQEDVDAMVARLRKKGFELTREGSFSEFLGIKFDKLADGSINMTQKGLINKIIENAGMTDCNPNWTPASTTPLGSDPDGEPMGLILAPVGASLALGPGAGGAGAHHKKEGVVLDR